MLLELIEELRRVSVPREGPEGLLHDDVARLQVAALLGQRGQVVVGLKQVAAQARRSLEERPRLRRSVILSIKVTVSYTNIGYIPDRRSPSSARARPSC